MAASCCERTLSCGSWSFVVVWGGAYFGSQQLPTPASVGTPAPAVLALLSHIQHSLFSWNGGCTCDLSKNLTNGGLHSLDNNLEGFIPDYSFMVKRKGHMTPWVQEFLVQLARFRISRSSLPCLNAEVGVSYYPE